MAYEVIFHYYERNKEDRNDYDTTTPQTMTKLIGRGSEEVSMDKLAGIVMAQLARRDIWVYDVEVYETIKRKVSFKETKGGVVIKHRKYAFDNSIAEVIDEIASADDSYQCVEREEPYPSPQNKVLRWEIFQPDKEYATQLKGIPLTIGNKYPIMQEKIISQNVGGESAYETQSLAYIVIDNNNKPITVHSCHFLPVTKGLYGIDYATDGVLSDDRMMPREQGGKLMYMGTSGGNDMPVIRR